MRHSELSVLNHIMLLNPQSVENIHMCKREEVAAPHKILLDGGTLDWQPYVRQRWSFCENTCGCYIVAPDSSRCLWDVGDDTDIFSWLCCNWDKRFIITYPVFRTQDGRRFSYSHVSPYIVWFDNVTDAPHEILLHHKCYAVCNGLILALAMHRQQRWHESRFLPALTNFVNNHLESDAPWTFMVSFDDEWIEYYSGHILQILDFPAHYALCGGTDVKVIDFLLKSADGPSPYIQYVGGGRSKYVSHTSTAFASPSTLNKATFKRLQKFERWPERSPLHTPGDTSEPDWTGFAQLITSRKVFWREWRTQPTFRRLILGRLRMCCCAHTASQKGLFNLAFPTLFLLYSKMSKYTSRVRCLWRDLIEFYNPDKTILKSWLKAYIMRVRVTDTMARSFPEEVIRHPFPPVAFLIDVFGHKMDAPSFLVESEYRFWINTLTDTRSSYLNSCGLPLATLPNGGYSVKSSLQKNLQSLAPIFPPAHIYLKYYVEKPVVQKLICIRRAVSDVSGSYIIESLLFDHFRRHREDLY